MRPSSKWGTTSRTSPCPSPCPSTLPGVRPTTRTLHRHHSPSSQQVLNGPRNVHVASVRSVLPYFISNTTANAALASHPSTSPIDANFHPPAPPSWNMVHAPVTIDQLHSSHRVSTARSHSNPDESGQRSMARRSEGHTNSRRTARILESRSGSAPGTQGRRTVGNLSRHGKRRKRGHEATRPRRRGGGRAEGAVSSEHSRRGCSCGGGNRGG